MTTSKLTRRGFFGTAAAMGAAFSTVGVGSLKADAGAAKAYKTELHKAFICPVPTEENIKAHAEAGFEGCEVTNWNQTEEEIKAGKKAGRRLRHAGSFRDARLGFPRCRKPGRAGSQS
jgi:hypothetical protein